jgi:hypothetical protein
MRDSKERKHAFLGTIYYSEDGRTGVIRPNEIRRMDGEPLGLTIIDDVFVHINAFKFMAEKGYEQPARVAKGMMVAFLLGPSGQRPGRITAEYCSVYEHPR